MDLERFVRHFGFRVVNINHHDPYSRRLDSYSGYSQSYYTKPEIESTVEMEIDRRRLEHMANYFEQCERLDKEDREEEWLRRQYPALKNAHDKYKMLLALYK
jgi:hypothetical protein